MIQDRQPAPAEGALRCGECERKLVVYHLKILECLARGEYTRESTAKAAVLREAAASIQNGDHEHGAMAIPSCRKCEDPK